MNRTLMHTGAVLLTAATLAACSSSPNEAGTTAAPSTTSTTSSGVDTAVLKPGNYPITPRPAEPWSPAAAIKMQAREMADFVVGPWEADPDLTRGLVQAYLITDAAKLKGVLLEAGTKAAEHHFINAFTDTRVDRNNPAGKRLVTMVMRFPTPEDARAAAIETSAALGSYLKAGAQETAFIPGHPETYSTQSPQPGGKYQVTGLTARGAFVLYQEAQSPESAEAAAALVGKTLDLQIPRIDGYHPSDPAQQQSLDPTGLAAKTLPGPVTNSVGVYGAYGALHFSQDPPKTEKRYTAAGVDFEAEGATTVIQTKDPAAATALASTIFDANNVGKKPGPTVAGLPTAKCVESADAHSADPTAPPNYQCVTPMGRWVVLAAAQQAADITQQVAAQYLLLIGK
ncbi:hypothetical protein CIW52_00805 [Mycolicibacterium sp. P9-64]|uniref:DUF7373 family lipoprotein n=1 Tax=Mycolicibacterium sp. P9-64 TaxID=2024612 RepID=UPI0011EEA59A|nr:hypothetical protein [Mycolicibacterium sp. P9-64]KAA0086509.1 hypothetical protein CIW52_00805 [Mycolicibacterium sp. P9-64]